MRLQSIAFKQQYLLLSRYIRAQKQIPNIERISRYMQREHSVSPADTDLQLKYAVEDQLIVSYTTVGFKGAKVGMEQEGFKVPEGDDEEFVSSSDAWWLFQSSLLMVGDHTQNVLLNTLLCRVFAALYDHPSVVPSDLVQ